MPKAGVAVRVANVISGQVAGCWKCMNYLPQVVRSRSISGFIVSTRFDDGTEKYIDVSQWFKDPVFEPPKLFKKFFIEGRTLAWPNGLDIAPVALYAARDLKNRHNKAKRR